MNGEKDTLPLSAGQGFTCCIQRKIRAADMQKTVDRGFIDRRKLSILEKLCKVIANRSIKQKNALRRQKDFPAKTNGINSTDVLSLVKDRALGR
ncbi:hypothetical protein SDC9_208493 [bioreactor metagenome]|uniref:Uncharacterized protein n=1 Tax=bioreactor metagenome TaxID=1076179 RepID=A0A645JAX3_9ZZZZ